MKKRKEERKKEKWTRERESDRERKKESPLFHGPLSTFYLPVLLPFAKDAGLQDAAAAPENNKNNNKSQH